VFSVNSVVRLEGNAGPAPFIFRIERSGDTALSSIVSLSTVDGTATSPGDYTGVSGNVTFAPGEKFKDIAVNVNGDTAFEANESFTLQLVSVTTGIISPSGRIGTATIVNDDTDPTPPVVTPIATGTLGSNGWYTSDVNVTWTVTDPESPVSGSTGCGASSVTTDTSGVTFTCLATSAGGSANGSVTIKRDATPPIISSLPAPTAEATGPGGATVSWSGPNATDGLDSNPALTCSAISGGLFSLGTTTVSCTAVDVAGNSTAAGFDIKVVDTTAPTISGLPANISVFATSAGSATVVWQPPTGADLVDGSVLVVCSPPSGSNFNHGLTTVSCSAKDSGNNSGSKQFTVEVRNAPPTANAGGPYAVGEGGTVALRGVGSDVEGTSLSYAWDLDNDGSYETVGRDPVFSAIGVDGPTSRTVGLRVTDGAGLSALSTATVNVFNVAPTLISVSGPLTPAALGSTTTIALIYSDPAGNLDQYTPRVEWGDGTVNSDVTHVYATPGVYRAKAFVVDDDGGISNLAAYEFMVIYDTAAGYVTGGGWIMSGSGACSDIVICGAGDPTGQANFGFNSQYKPGKSVPSGETQFDFKQGNLKFHSENYEWMVVSGNRVQYRGEGTINGSGQYRFVLTATDGKNAAADKFRIRIMRVGAGGGDGAVVYDNHQGGAIDSLDAGTEISGGNIIIHN
jgi:hypothetical protein